MATNNNLSNQSTNGFSVTNAPLALPTTTSTAGQLTINSARFLHSFGTGNTFVGSSSGSFTLTGNSNVGIGTSSFSSASNAGSQCVAVGFSSLSSQTTGTNNTALGYTALRLATTSVSNTAIGNNALGALTTGLGLNVAIGEGAMDSATTTDQCVAVGYLAANTLSSGNKNVAIGTFALNDATTANNCVALGFDAQDNLMTGVYNISIGSGASFAHTGAESHNIIINSVGVVSESNTLRIGAGTGTGTQQLNSAFVSGINGITVTGAAVLVSSSDQLGIAVSSKRFKDNIRDMGKYSSSIMDLRPVVFKYTVGNDVSTQSGLIAEEVELKMPSLLVYDKEGKPQTVKYHDLPALLLNELQKLAKRVEYLEGVLHDNQ